MTFVAGSSYDELFSHYQQKATEGTQVLVYAAYSYDIDTIYQALLKNGDNGDNGDNKDNA